jgi:Ser/Thr protein kinase RdoA (MazF antagonist)
MTFIDFNDIVSKAWEAYDSSREIVRIEDISAKVSTNHVYRITLKDRNFVVAKLSYFGLYDHFVEDHAIINAMANNLPEPFENFLARSLFKGSELYVYRFKTDLIDAWVVFYRPVKILDRLPKKLKEEHIHRLGSETARFHEACSTIKNSLPVSSKTMLVDIEGLEKILDTDEGKFQYRGHINLIKEQCEQFKENYLALAFDKLESIPVFVDWNIGNFSTTDDLQLFSRWDYDWFRMSSRMMDFYFFSRVVSEVGDRTIFTYNIDVLMQPRFLMYLEAYHKRNPLSEREILFLKECYRFFLLNYVVKYGTYFFHEIFATRLQKETLEVHLPSIEKKFDETILLKALNL